MAKKETILDIAKSIDHRTRDERSNGYKNRAIARCLVETKSSLAHQNDRELVCFLTNYEQSIGRMVKDWTGTSSHWESGPSNTSNVEGMPVYKNTKMGEVLSKFWQGQHSYSIPTKTKNSNDVTVNILNKTSYDNFGSEVKEIELRMSGDKEIYRFALLKDLLRSNTEDQKRLEEEKEKMRKLQEEKRRKEEEERIAKEKAEEAERKRLEEERRKREAEERERQAEIERLEKSIEETNKKINSIKSFLRTGVELRSQHLLDEFQEDAKRSHLFDGTAVIIEGGPGTGKTTTTIQRLKFLLSKSALDEYDNPLTEAQKNFLTDRQEWNQRWLFFSPTDLLLQYLRNNMAQEELIADDKNTRTLERFRTIKMREYGLFDPSKDGPFKNYKISHGEEELILQPERVINDFEQFCINFIRESMDKRVALKTNEYSWHNLALSIKSTYTNMKVADLDGLMRLLNALCDRDKSSIKAVDTDLRNTLSSEAVKVQKNILDNDDAVNKIIALFEQWKREKMQLEDDDEDDVTTDEEREENEELEAFNKQDFESQLFSTLKKLLRKIGLGQIESKTKLSKRDEAFWLLAEPYITEDINLKRIGELALFTKNFASMCRGIESGLIRQIPKIYKAYRKRLLTNKSDLYTIPLLDAIVKKDNNKHLHPEEQNLLLGFLNSMFFNIHKKSKIRFNELKNKYTLAYKDSVRPVIGIDEATDYSLLDYYFMVSFRHYEFSSITLCGDIMQGLNTKGVEKWESLQKTFILPSLDVKKLNISYRQLPTLVDVSKEMYKDDQGSYPSYNSEREKSTDEPAPLLMISDDEDEKAEWISRRIIEIYQTYGTLPSVAIFVGDKVDIREFIQRIEDLDMLDGIEIVDCSGGKKLDSKEVVRVFRLSEVKGMEFEAVFFYDIDKAIENHSSKIMRRHLYVGVSRATSHLAATMTSIEGNEAIAKYFDKNIDSWS